MEQLRPRSGALGGTYGDAVPAAGPVVDELVADQVEIVFFEKAGREIRRDRRTVIVTPFPRDG